MCSVASKGPNKEPLTTLPEIRAADRSSSDSWRSEVHLTVDAAALGGLAWIWPHMDEASWPLSLVKPKTHRTPRRLSQKPKATRSTGEGVLPERKGEGGCTEHAQILLPHSPGPSPVGCEAEDTAWPGLATLTLLLHVWVARQSGVS